jgi:dihydrofolate synthase/folylpolyglutamate synthase
MKSNHRPFPEISSRLPSNLEFIFNLSPSAMTLGLANMRALLTLLGEPQRAFPAVLIAGTNGKGSVAAYLSSLLNANGLKTGRYTSPHVYSVTERIAVAGRRISLEKMEEHASRIVPLHSSVPFSYFEAITAIAFLEFAEQAVDIAVLEVGLGGRFDATNVTDPVVSIITNISLDHRRLLGDTEEEILREKLGIAREGIPLLIGNLSGELCDLLRRRQARDRFDLLFLGDIGSALRDRRAPGKTRVRMRTGRADYGMIELPFAGDHQADNALLALGAAEYLLQDVRDVPRAFVSAYMPGRFERIECRGKTIVLDVAHNDAALSRLAETYAGMFPAAGSAVILGIMRRKELAESPARLRKAARRFYLIAPETGDGFSPHELFERLRVKNAFNVEGDVILWNGHDASSGWDRLVESVLDPRSGIANILVTGSHHTVESFGRRLPQRRLQ